MKKNYMLKLVLLSQLAFASQPTLAQEVTVETEINHIQRENPGPIFQAYALDRRAGEYERAGQFERANRLTSEATLLRQKAGVSAQTPGKVPTMCILLDDIEPNRDGPISQLIRTTDRIAKVGCLGKIGATGTAHDLTSYGLHAEAARYYEQALPCKEKDGDTEEHYFILRSLAVNYIACGDYNRAEKTLISAKTLALTKMEDPFKKRTKAGKAITNWLKSTDASLRPENGEFGAIGNAELALGKLYIMMRRFTEAQDELEAAGQFWKKLNDKEFRNPEAATYQRLASLDLRRADKKNIAKALVNARLAVKIAGDDAKEKVLALRTLGDAYNQIEQLDSARVAWSSGLTLARTVLGKSHPYYARLLDDLSKLYQRTGRSREAMTFQVEAYGIAAFLFASLHKEPQTDDPVEEIVSYWEVNYDFMVGNLILDRRLRDMRMQAYPYVEQLSTRNNLSEKINSATLLVDAGSYAQADTTLASALALSNTIADEQLHVPLLMLYATTRQAMGDGSQAVRTTQMAYDRLKTSFGQLHPLYLETIHQLATLLAKQGDQKQADQLFTMGRALLRNQQTFQASYLSEEEFFASRIEYDRLLNQQLSFYAQTAETDTASASRLYELALFQKGIVLRNYAQVLQQADHGEVQQLIAFRKRRDELAARPKTLTYTEQKELAVVKNQITTTERRFVQQAAAAKRTTKPVTWQSVAAQVGLQGAVLELIRVNTGPTEQRYFGLVTRPDWQAPRVVALGTEQQWKKLEPFTRQTASRIDQLYKPGSGLYDLGWKPLEKLLVGITTLYVSPIGAYSRIAFGAIALPDGKKVADKLTIRYMLSTAQVATELGNTSITRPLNTLLVGNVEYACNGTVSGTGSLPLTFNGASIMYIDSLLRGAKWNRTTLTGQSATEAALMETVQQPFDVIHLATHGISTPKSEVPLEVFQRSSWNGYGLDNYLCMAGSDCVDPQETDKPLNGWLTTSEISSYLALKARLVVLSACSSALGEDIGNEGTFGLYRAFKSAGATYVLATLWEVDDQHTAEFMKAFYRNLIRPKTTIEAAFDTTQKALKNKAGWTTYHWGGLVLIR